MWTLIPALANTIASFVAAYTDFKTGYIYDWITYPLIGLGILWSVTQQEWTGIIFGGIIYGIGYLAYRIGKIGGGDVKLLAGIAIMQPTLNGMIFPLAVLIVAALAASAGFGIYYAVGLWKKKVKIEWNTQRKKVAAIMGLSVGIVLFHAAGSGYYPESFILTMGGALLFGMIFYALEEEIKKHYFLKWVSVSELEEEEILAQEALSEEDRKTWGESVPALLGAKEIAVLQTAKIGRVPVYRDLPRFGPFLFAGVVLTYALPEWVAVLVPAIL